MIERREYIDKLLSWKDERVIKVVTGMRRVGKSTLLAMYRENLIKLGVNNEQIISINLEDLAYEDLSDYRRLYDYISDRLVQGGMTYIFLDEVQRVQNFEKAVDSLQLKENVDIYITSSNAHFLSGDLATYLSGRYVEINLLPFSFKEFLSAQKNNENRSPDNVFADYIEYGGLPYIATMPRSKEKAEAYLEGIYSTVIIKDIEERQQRSIAREGTRKITDMALLRKIAIYLADTIGSPISVKKITDYIVSSGRRVSQNTVSDYIQALIEPFIFYNVSRYDIRGKELLIQGGKYYIVDLGLRRHLLTKSSYDLGYSLENIVYFELLRRGYTVNIGKVGDLEVDFIAKKEGIIHYFQVTASMIDEKTFNRELTPLKVIKDNYSKTLITLDRFSIGNYDGIKIVNAIDWLLDQ